MSRFLSSFIFLFGFWLICSGYFDTFHLSLGAISCALISYWTGPLLFQGKITMAQRLKEHLSFYPYGIWLFYQIILANFQVLKVAFAPDISKVISPQIVSFDSHFQRDISKFLIANSITLTPGTITIREENGTFKVHALNANAAAGVPGDMLKKVAKLFGEQQA